MMNYRDDCVGKITSGSEPHSVCEVRSMEFIRRCRNLPYKITNEEIYDIFGKYGDIRQIRV